MNIYFPSLIHEITALCENMLCTNNACQRKKKKQKTNLQRCLKLMKTQLAPLSSSCNKVLSTSLLVGFAFVAQMNKH